MRLCDFEPLQLLEALEQVRRLHPQLVGLEEEPGVDTLAELRERLLAAPDQGLAEFAHLLGPRELRSMVYLLATDRSSPVRARAAEVVLSRPRGDLVSLTWRLLRDNYPVNEAEPVARVLGESFGWWRAEPENSERLARWFSSESLPGGLLADFSSSGRRAEFGAWLSGLGFDSRHGLSRATWEMALLSASAELIDRIGHSALLDRAKGSHSVLQQGFGRHYLAVCCGGDRWLNEVLEWIRSRFGMPSRRDKGLTPFWRPVPAEDRQWFRQWAIQGTVRDFFKTAKDPYQRFAFWSGFLDKAVDARQALGQAAVLIDFGTFGVVEFAEVGNAAYLYPAATFDEIWSRVPRASIPADLKEPEATLDGHRGGPRRDGRIIHFQDWQRRHTPWIRSLLRR